MSGLAHREDGPADGPLALLVHGYPESSYMWHELMPALADAGWRSLAPDLAGFGDSEPDPPGTWERHVESIERFRSEQGVERCVLVVHDWGGLIGLRWACEHPEAIEALVISSTGFFSDGKWSGMAEALQTPGTGEELVDGLTRESFGGLLGSVSTGMTDAAVDEYFKAYADEPRRRGQLELYRSGDFSQLARYRLADLEVPVLLVWGETDPFAPLAGAHRFESELRRHRAGGDRGRRALRLGRRAGALRQGGHRLPCQNLGIERLFDLEDSRGGQSAVPGSELPLAARMRPASLGEFVGQEHLLGRGSALRTAIEEGRPHSMILYGPPGTGKTTLARLLAVNARAAFEEASAVNAGRAEVREVLARAEHRRQTAREPTIFFLDEIHRFNKAQQDTLLPAVEEGLVALVGATTENPYFEVNSALLSRCRVYELHALGEEHVLALLRRALGDERGIADAPRVADDALEFLASRAAATPAPRSRRSSWPARPSATAAP